MAAIGSPVDSISSLAIGIWLNDKAWYHFYWSGLNWITATFVILCFCLRQEFETPASCGLSKEFCDLDKEKSIKWVYPYAMVCITELNNT